MVIFHVVADFPVEGHIFQNGSYFKFHKFLNFQVTEHALSLSSASSPCSPQAEGRRWRRKGCIMRHVIVI